MLRSLALPLALIATDAGLAGGVAPATSGASLGRWTETRAAFCRYSVDVSGPADPHSRLETIANRSLVVCPFAASNAGRVRLFRATVGRTTCEAGDLPGLRVLKATAISLHDFDEQSQSCMAGHSTPSKEGERAPGKVYVITSLEPKGWDPFKTYGRVMAITQYGGLPIYLIRDQGAGSSEFLCLEMTAEADIDPLAYFRSAGVDFPPATRELKSRSPNCAQAIQALRHLPAAPAETAFPAYEGLRLSLRRSSDSPAGKSFDDAFLGSLARAGLPHELSADKSFSPLVPGDDRPLVIEGLDAKGVDLEVGRLNNKVCEAAFATMSRTQAFMRPPDDESPTIVLKGATGGPPPNYLAFSIQYVASAPELCAALTPAFDRWAAKHAAH